MVSTAATIEGKVKAFAKDITKFLNAKRASKVASLKKAGTADPDKALVTATFAYSSGKGSLSRSPEKQAEMVSGGTSWTCAGAHMVDKARHVKLLYGAPGKKAAISWEVRKAFGSGKEHFCSLADLKKKWASLMKTHGLKNFKGGDGWGEGDAFHFELPDSKVPHSDSRVQACLKHYAEITRVEGRGRNTKFETSSVWKGSLAPHLKAAEEKKKKRDAEKKREELKKLQLEGASTSTETLLKSVNGSKSKTGKTFAAILPGKDIEAGKKVSTPVSAASALKLDSIMRDILEGLGLADEKDADIAVICGVSYSSVTFANLTQSFIEGLTPTCDVSLKTPAARFIKVTVAMSGTVRLAKSAKAPRGTVTFDVTIDTPLKTFKGKVQVTLDGSHAISGSTLK
ncbi:MAG: hypothetical protein AAGG09_17405 [Pseudomonadota bacterium]